MAESTADTITTYDFGTIPGLLQTEAYAWALFREAGFVSEEKIESFVQWRIERQAILRRHDRPKCIFFVHEHALRMQVGDAEVMRAQFKRMLHRTHVVRVVPESCGPAGVFMAYYALWQYERATPVAFTESDIAKVFVQEPSGIATCRSIFDRLDEVALDAGQSRSLLADLAGQPRKDPHDSGVHLA